MDIKRSRLRRQGLELRLMAMRKGLTNRAIAKALNCHEALVSKAFKGMRIEALKRVGKYVRSYRTYTPSAEHRDK